MDKKKTYFGIKASLDNSTLELFFTDYIYDGIDWYTWEATNMVQDTIDKIKAANPTTIKVTINSLGGDVMIGLALYNYLKNYNAEIEVEVIGFAASIASVIAMCASPGKLEMAKNSFMILHAASSYAGGNAKDLREEADVLDKISGEMAEIYAGRSGKTGKYFTDMWSDGGDHWLTATEAKAIGLVDELIDATLATARVDIASSGFKNIPTALLINNKKPNITMAFEKTLKAAKAQSFAVVDGGFLLTENDLNNSEAEIARLDAAIDSANLLNQQGQSEVTKITAELATTTTAKDAAEKAVKENAATITTQAAKIVELEAEVVKLGAGASGNGTPVPGAKKDEVITDTKPGAKISLMHPDHPINQAVTARLPKKVEQK